MANVTRAVMSYGEIRFFPEERDGDMETPAHFETSFQIAATIESDGIELINAFEWKSLIPERSADTPYYELESRAARQIAPMLRAVADYLDKEIEDHDARRKAKSEQNAS